MSRLRGNCSSRRKVMMLHRTIESSEAKRYDKRSFPYDLSSYSC